MKEAFTSFIKDEENIVKQKKLQCAEPINETKFDVIFNSIKNTEYENKKIIQAKKLLSDACLSSEQIKKISALFTHDREKLEFMKCAYNVLTDKANGNVLANEFQFKDTKDEFLKHISQ